VVVCRIRIAVNLSLRISLLLGSDQWSSRRHDGRHNRSSTANDYPEEST
jgi:hypothetical protein